jgi:2-keto-4-pentenoate hydratase/2-oxohepta-3-ene-1,7-dioic acid hydratase in catechol pathway
MKLACIAATDTPYKMAVAGKLEDREWRVLLGAPPMMDLLDTASLDDLQKLYENGLSISEEQIQFMPPVTPTKILAIGQNYMDHIREQNGTPPAKPLIFAKMPSSVIAHRSIIEWNPTIATAVDYEAELAVVIGKTAKQVSPEDALNYVFGYTCANDVTARDLQKGDGQWTRAKGMDTFCPLGPYIVTADEISDPQNLRVRCEVNGEVRQDSTSAEMIFDTRTIISYMSQVFTLCPGDIILTGTPNGVGFYRNPQALLKDGDHVVVEVERVARLENTCRENTTT